MITALKDFYKGKRVLVTGHTGFKGAWLLVCLHELQAEVQGYALAPEEPALYTALGGDQLCQSAIADIRDAQQLSAVVQAFQPELIFHMAAQPLVLDAYEQPVYTFDVNAMGTAHLLESVKKIEGGCIVINITTDKVYDNQEWYYPYRETDALGGYDPYSASKACAELVTASYRSSFFNPNQYETHQTSIATVRAGNVIGGGDWAKNRIIPDIVRAVAKDEEVILRNPQAVRPWQHVLEALMGYLLLGLRMSEAPKELATAFNFGPLYDESITVENLVQIAIKAWGRGHYQVQQQAKQAHEANLLRLDCSKAVKILQWRPVWNAQAAIEQTIAWYKAVEEGEQTALAMTQAQIQAYWNQ